MRTPIISQVLVLIASILLIFTFKSFADEGFTTDKQYMEHQPDLNSDTKLPQHVTHGSVAITNSDIHSLAMKAYINIEQASNTAEKKYAGKIVKAELVQENSVLIWLIDMVAISGDEVQIKIDAGNGRILASVTGDSGNNPAVVKKKHRPWRYWDYILGNCKPE